jgi:hypothetical protein
MLITPCDCVFLALGIQRAMRISRIVLSSVACLAVRYFSALSHKRYDFRKKKILNIKLCFDFLCNICLKNFYSNENWARCDHKFTLVFMYSKVILSDFNDSWNFLTHFRKILQYQISLKSFKWERSCSMLTDRRTDPQTEEERDRRTDSHDEINSRFGNSVKVPNNPV